MSRKRKFKVIAIDVLTGKEVPFFMSGSIPKVIRVKKRRRG